MHGCGYCNRLFQSKKAALQHGVDKHRMQRSVLEDYKESLRTAALQAASSNVASSNVPSSSFVPPSPHSPSFSVPDPVSSDLLADSEWETHIMSDTESETKSKWAFSRDLFNSPKYSDITLLLGPEAFIFHSHQLILGNQSAYFDAAFASGTKETLANEFKLENYSPQALWRVFHFMYTGSYASAPTFHLHTSDDHELLMHPRVYFIADMFQLHDLKTLAVDKFKHTLNAGWESEMFPECIREVYENTFGESGLRAAVVEVSKGHIMDLSESLTFQDKLSHVEDFAVDLIKLLAKPSTPKQENPDWRWQ